MLEQAENRITEKKEIIICLGSSCFSRGNRICLAIIEKFLRDHKMEDQYSFRGSRCFDKCANGPVLRIGNEVYKNVNPGEVEELLKRSLIK